MNAPLVWLQILKKKVVGIAMKQNFTKKEIVFLGVTKISILTTKAVIGLNQIRFFIKDYFMMNVQKVPQKQIRINVKNAINIIKTIFAMTNARIIQ